ncbi:MAG: hypothetical protein Q4P07_11685 [Ornithinimicrobium sp.]|uniref:hypothetical protein n=1 Tax=Ornithinimicrobium sp. TaxID=1977084 RepID=UPI0026E0A6B4|nr:hypothetical protein [Ornithinimicrobium sp.]MDO5740794.1 hypothetical protein [Ornithinimicrobium sp.]
MSYDILLYPRASGQGWESVLAADEVDTPDHITGDEGLLAEGVATFRRISSRLENFLTGEVETWVAEETGGDVLGELSEIDSGLQVELFHGSGAVSFPYWEREDPESFYTKVREAVRIVAEETGYQAYDPQTDQDFDGHIADAGGLEAARTLAGGPDGEPRPADGQSAAVDGADPDNLTDGALADDTDAPARGRRQLPPRTPEQVQRRAVIDLVLGVALVSYGVWRRNAGDTGILVTILMILGAMNLFGGIMSLFTAKRLRDHAAAEQPAVEDSVIRPADEQPGDTPA